MGNAKKSNTNEECRKFYEKAASLISNKDKRDKIIRFLNAYISSEYVAKTIQIEKVGDRKIDSVYKATSIEPSKIKNSYCNNGCTYEDLQYVFNKQSYKNRKTCRYIRNKIVHCFDEASINLILKDDFYINKLNKIIHNFD